MLLATDAAHKHGNESSSPPQSPSLLTSNGYFLTQMPLSIIGSVLRCQSPTQSPAPTNIAQTTSNAPDATTPQKHVDVMTAPLDTPTATPVPSRPASSGSSDADEQPKKRAPRSKTSYLYARPPKPVECRSKLHIRPKVLAQLHQIVPSQRPKPAYEIVPFPLLPARSTRRLARTFNTRERLGPTDLLIVKAESYGSQDEETKSEDDRWASREVVGVICPARNEKGVTDICMDDGTSRWEVTAMPNGGFEFNTTDDHGLTLKARWVLKSARTRRVSSVSTAAPLSPVFGPGQDDKKFTFSTISANSRRHPIIATMTHSRIDIMDSYSMPSATSPPTPVSLLSSPLPATPASIDMESFISDNQLPILMDEALRRFILVTGTWVASQSYCAVYPSSVLGQAYSPFLEASSRPSSNRTLSMSFLDSPRSASPASTVDEHRLSLPRLLKNGIDRLPRSTSFSAESTNTSLSSKDTSNASPVQKTRSRRANSTGNTNFFTLSGSMRRRHGLAFQDEPLPESEEERQVKRSVELLRIKELALPERLSSETSVNNTHPTVTTIPLPIVTRPSNDGTTSPAPLLSPPLPDPERSRKTQSAYQPIETAGLWDSGVTERSGLKSRPTSMFVINEKKKKQERKRERSRNKEDKKPQVERFLDEKDAISVKIHGDWHRLKNSFKNLFRREKA